jgi:hypothetical protein
VRKTTSRSEFPVHDISTLCWHALRKRKTFFVIRGAPK